MMNTDASPRLLIADDEEGIREMLSAYFEAVGFQVVTAKDGDEAIMRLRDDADYDVVLLDVIMPGRTGVAVLQEMQETGILYPVIMMTAYNPLRERIEALDLGAVDMVQKPFSIEELEASVERALRSAA